QRGLPCRNLDDGFERLEALELLGVKLKLIHDREGSHMGRLLFLGVQRPNRLDQLFPESLEHLPFLIPITAALVLSTSATARCGPQAWLARPANRPTPR